MIAKAASSILLALCLSLAGCVPETSLESGSTGSSHSRGSTTGPGGMRIGNANPAPPPNLTEEQVRLGFLTAYIDSDRSSALHYATPEAIAKLPWRTNAASYIPHYDDKGIFWFDGGLAHVTYGKVNGRNMITDFKVHHR